MMAYTLIIFTVINGIVSFSMSGIPVQLNSKQACEKAARSILEDSKGIAVICISAETGEVARIK